LQLTFRIAMRTVAGLLVVVVGVLISCSSNPPPASDASNHPPVIDSVVVSGAAIVGQQVEITCYARDPDGDELNYFWRANDGDIVGHGMQVKFFPAPCCSGLNTTVEVTVQDAHGAKAQRSIVLFVL
jgi:hypothetical protein